MIRAPCERTPFASLALVPSFDPLLKNIAPCRAAGPEKPEAYSLTYGEDYSGTSTTRMVADRSPQSKGQRRIGS
jgi:hypothetical protein